LEHSPLSAEREVGYDGGSPGGLIHESIPDVRPHRAGGRLATRDAQQERPALPKPDQANAKYGPHEPQRPRPVAGEVEKTTPLVVYIHGGGFRGGDKSSLSPGLLEAAAWTPASRWPRSTIGCRSTPRSPRPMHDGGRAVQFLRSQAKDWNLDPKRIAATGGSAGAGISLWLGFHDDLADPKSDDPVARQSTRLSCMAVLGAQSSYDPRFIKKVVGGKAHEHPALLPFYGLKPEEVDSEKAYKLYEEAPITHLNAGDVPAFLFYTEDKDRCPTTPNRAGHSSPELRRCAQGEDGSAEDRVRAAASGRLQGQARPLDGRRDDDVLPASSGCQMIHRGRCRDEAVRGTAGSDGSRGMRGRPAATGDEMGAARRRLRGRQGAPWYVFFIWSRDLPRGQPGNSSVRVSPEGEATLGGTAGARAVRWAVPVRRSGEVVRRQPIRPPQDDWFEGKGEVLKSEALVGEIRSACERTSRSVSDPLPRRDRDSKLETTLVSHETPENPGRRPWR
jgi:hypothetical protein